MPATLPITFSIAKPEEGNALAELRVEAMRESLERIGRFDPSRARERFLSGISPHGFVQVEHSEFDNYYVRRNENGL
jgi:hypothetical protein